MTPRRSWRTKRAYLAECEGCNETPRTLSDGEEVRDWAKRHHDRTGHRVRVEVTYARYYTAAP